MKKFYKIVVSIFLLASFGIFFNISPVHDLSEQEAFAMIFGNYDSVHQSSIWKNMNLGKQEVDSFWVKKTGIVSKVLFQAYKENGNRKVFLLTKTVPIEISFECHACLPLLSAIVFTRNDGKWNIESQNRFLMYEGEYGTSPKAKLISVGKNKHGLLLEFEHWGGGTNKEIALLIPYKKCITNAYQEIIYYDNFSDCGWSIQCAAFTAKLEFNKSKIDQGYYQLKVEKFGTDNDETQNYKAVPVDEEVLYRFLDGKYVQISRKGFPKMEYK